MNISSNNMTVITTSPYVKDGCLTVNGKVVTAKVPSNVVVSPASPGSAFLGATSAIPRCRHVFSLGVLQDCRFICIFKSKIWWMIPRVGKSGHEIPMETQMLLLEAKEESALADDASCPTNENTFYILLLPVLDGPFRTSFQGAPSNELLFCVESCDASVQTTQVSEAVFVNSGDSPYELIKSSMKILERHKGTFQHIENKKLPAHLDWFGWCTWDAFYKDVNPLGIKEGLESFLEGGCPPKFLIIDDGWQDTINEFLKDGEPHVEGTQLADRLVDIKEGKHFMASAKENISCSSFHDFVKFIKEKYGLKFVYVWHALLGYWGGVLPISEAMKKYNPKMVYPKQSPGNVGNLRDIALDSLERYGVGIIDPKKISDFYNDLHSYLASCGVDGVKVDVQNLMETLGSGYGGRVTLTRQYQGALEESIVRSFKNNNLICCMSHNTDSIYSSKRSASARASEDFMPWDPTTQTLHVASVAFNSLFIGEILVPDWDMFLSNHYTAEFHAAARAVGGCPVYVSDKPYLHDFKILRRLVLPDSSVLRARYAGRPTRDCLFIDPVMDGKSLLKIWNLNKFSGIIGVFNCQGAGNWPLKKPSDETPSNTVSLSGNVSPCDVENLKEVAGDDWSEDCAIYEFHTASLTRLPKDGKLEASLETLKCEIYTICPIRIFDHGIKFAPIGLVDMYNSGGTIQAICSKPNPSGCKITIKARGCGRFGAYSETKPCHCKVNAKEQKFLYNEGDGLLTFELGGDCNAREIDIVY